MKWCTIEDVTKTLDEALRHKLCVQVWFGIGNTLFIGFGTQVIPDTPKGKHHTKPPYEIETGSTDWFIQDEHGVAATSNSLREDAEAAIKVVVGKRVVDWHYDNGSVALCIDFEYGLTLKMVPYNDNYISQDDAWILRDATHYGFVRWDGIMGNGRLDHYFVDEHSN